MDNRNMFGFFPMEQLNHVPGHTQYNNEEIAGPEILVGIVSLRQPTTQ